MHFHILIANFAIAVSTACRFLKKIIPTMTKKKAYEQYQTYSYICWTWFEANALVLNSCSLR